ncbi:lipase/esterase domain protein [Mycobacterium ulcerans str. Harvey]|uniref:Lipase/esterase domain protein n=1 Tax=Mycobacterium ulcerans str. Harvey TaxID=1299332 RepID=A0ABP3AGE3_MYCUL|nr:lipase/esterase domain protein [Mycobacterium ulcerans str. Harvey]
MQNTVTVVGAKVIPWVPDVAKRLITRGRSVIIDGNTLDPALQLMLSGMRVVGLDGLVIDDDLAASRATCARRCWDFPVRRSMSMSRN